jgi:peptide/nickel transport system substrate-binding protein
MIDLRTLLAASPALLALPRGARAADTTSMVLDMGQEPRHFEGAIQSGTATAVSGTQIFASPLRYDADWKPQSYLAKSWEVAPDALSVTLHLVENALFHDGQPVTSDDVAFSIGVIKANHPFTTMLAPVASVETPDPHTVVIKLKHPHPALLLSMSPALMPILPKHVYGDCQDILTHPANLKPVGSGPFHFAEYVRSQFIRLERFDRRCQVGEREPAVA